MQRRSRLLQQVKHPSLNNSKTSQTGSEPLNHQTEFSGILNWKNLPSGVRIRGDHQGANLYEVVKPLMGDTLTASGSGGTVYLVKEISIRQEQIVEKSSLKEVIPEMEQLKPQRRVVKSRRKLSEIESKKAAQQQILPLTSSTQSQQETLYVMKIFSTDQEMSFFYKEVNASIKIAQGHQNIVKVKEIGTTMKAMFQTQDRQEQNIVHSVTQFSNQNANQMEQSSPVPSRRVRRKTNNFKQVDHSKTIQNKIQTPATLECTLEESKIKQNQAKYANISQIGQIQAYLERRTIGFIIFQLCPKDDLFAYVKSGLTRYNERLCRTLFQQILQGVHFMHYVCGVAHLDIKLENIVLDSNYIPKFIDFAYSDPVGQDLTEFRGTELYMAPEIYAVKELQQQLAQYSESRVLSNKMDQFSTLETRDESLSNYMSTQFTEVNESKNIASLQSASIQESEVPENLFDQKQLSFRGEFADMYALGILLFIMFFGVPPLKHHNLQSLKNEPQCHQLFLYLVSGDTKGMQVFLENHPLTQASLKRGLVSEGFISLLARLLSLNPCDRPLTDYILRYDPWINDPRQGMSYEEYSQIMNRQYLLNHGLIDQISEDFEVNASSSSSMSSTNAPISDIVNDSLKEEKLSDIEMLPILSKESNHETQVNTEELLIN